MMHNGWLVSVDTAAHRKLPTLSCQPADRHYQYQIYPLDLMSTSYHLLISFYRSTMYQLYHYHTQCHLQTTDDIQCRYFLWGKNYLLIKVSFVILMRLVDQCNAPLEQQALKALCAAHCVLCCTMSEMLNTLLLSILWKIFFYYQVDGKLSSQLPHNSTEDIINKSLLALIIKSPQNRRCPSYKDSFQDYRRRIVGGKYSR